MNPVKSIVIAGALTLAAIHSTPAHADLIPSADKLTVYDTTLHVTWLANADLAGTPGGKGTFGVSGINADGSMDWDTAQKWLSAMNLSGYMGHHDWQLPASPKVPATDGSCQFLHGGDGNSFGFGCTADALGSLFYQKNSLGIQPTDTAVRTPDNTVASKIGSFTNFQPYLYWTGTPNVKNPDGIETVSFNTGFQGSNVSQNYLYVLPMINGAVAPTAGTLYDPVANVTWASNANLAGDLALVASLKCRMADGSACIINSDGSMTGAVAARWIDALNGKFNGGNGYLGLKTWTLPMILDSHDLTCSNQSPTESFGFGCTGIAAPGATSTDPLGELFYDQLPRSHGVPVVTTPDNSLQGFKNIKPYLYWSCVAQPGPLPPSGVQTLCTPGVQASDNFEFTFSLGNGFLGTDFDKNEMYAMVYYADPVSEPATLSLFGLGLAAIGLARRTRVKPNY